MSKKAKQSGFSSMHILLLIVSLALVGYVGYTVKQRAAIEKEKNMYTETESQVEEFVNKAASLARSTKEVRKYCSYTSEKFDKGGLGCVVEGRIRFERSARESFSDLVGRAKILEKDTKWRYVDQENNNADEIRAVYYEFLSLSCSIHYKHAESLIQIGCSGPAMREYYPV